MVENTSTAEITGARVLESLLEALAAWPDLGSRARVSIEQWSSLTADEARAYQDVSISAVRSVAGGGAASDLIRTLGRLRYEPSVPTLIALWEQCPVHPIAVAAAHALFEIGTVEARDALRKGIHDHEHLGRFMALKVMFTDEGTAWDNVSHLFAPECLTASPGQIAAAEALSLLSPRMLRASGPEWHSADLRDLVSRDRRWLDLCVGLRDHEDLGGQARQVLKYADPAVTGPALDAAGAARSTQPRPVRRQWWQAGDLVARYANGDHQGVWRELGTVEHLDGPQRAEAEQVAAMTMERVRRNAHNLTAALIARGWPVTLDQALPGPASDVEEHLRHLEQITGTPAPPALAAYWRIVGTIDLVPRDAWNAPFPPGVPEQLAVADPLEVLDLPTAWFSVDEWQDESADLHPEIAGPLELMIAADYLHKANISGGAPYSVWLPYTGADPLVREEEHFLSFTDYLRRAFAGKGFLRLDRQDEWLAHGLTRDHLAGLTGWLASVEYEHTDF
ncbi:hypothetical protein [Streptacidiphilus jiangxiensis]|uniref:Uncharacterized protein n=1 Tax=Streptacidiphilus jiangxiensis TaxID=235985 RepID=A0A1H7PBN1_STRJI|nr:hypothetical protein [Streptacidiphilus jiangxiensis]SEL33153.1 hypothetical protein SAMN05414137_107309 [Streptacidiphilus jiangxiensis]